MYATNKTLLRPAFTRQLAMRLQHGECINLTAPHGFGRRRTLQDLRSVFPPDMGILHIDMKCSADDFSATWVDLCTQARRTGTDFRHLGQLSAALAQQHAQSLLILHNFDLLRNQPHDPLFDSALLPYLSAFSRQPRLSLLTVCERIYADWPLPCQHLPLPPLQSANT